MEASGEPTRSTVARSRNTLLTGAGLACLTVATIYAVNALTRPDTVVRVVVDPQAVTAPTPGSLTVLSVDGAFWYTGLHGADRLWARLGIVLLWTMLGALLVMLAGRSAPHPERLAPGWLTLSPARTAVVAFLIAGLGNVPRWGESIGANVVLTASGSPAGLSARPVIVDLLWVGAGAAYLSAALWVRRRAVRPLVATTRDTVGADRG